MKITTKHTTSVSKGSRAKSILAHALTLCLFAAPAVLSAQTFTNPIQAADLNSFLVQVLDVVILLGSIAVVFFLIMAGLKYVTARGDEKQISEATKTLTYTIIGGAIVLGAKVIAMTIDSTVRQLGI